jgi:hypothetical protein
MMQDWESLLKYNPDTGVITWATTSRHVNAGDVAGYVCPRGYRYISVGGKKQSAHRLAWFLSYGVWPEDQVDHINGDKTDNRLVNLRSATKAQNNRNVPKRA